jgi:hypothetical protein
MSFLCFGKIPLIPRKLSPDTQWVSQEKRRHVLWELYCACRGRCYAFLKPANFLGYVRHPLDTLEEAALVFRLIDGPLSTYPFQHLNLEESELSSWDESVRFVDLGFDVTCLSIGMLKSFVYFETWEWPLLACPVLWRVEKFLIIADMYNWYHPP